MKRYRPLVLILFLLGLLVGPWGALAAPAQPAATTYYVSSSAGSDDYDGLSESAPFETLAKINGLDLLPGDSVLLKCGDTWNAEQLIISHSGTAASPLRFGSYPADCADKPRISGSRAVSGWTVHTGNIYVADLASGDNAGKFALGINQLFKADERLPFGRWPNIEGHAEGGYSFVDAFPATHQLTDNELPPVDWSGAIVRIKTERWLLVNREVLGSSGTTLTLNEALACRGGTCAGWGYFIQNHISTLDQEGEWYYDAATQRVYIYSTAGVPSGLSASVIVTTADAKSGGLMLGSNAPISYVIVENLEISRWFNHGISAPGSMRGDIYHHLTLRRNLIKDVDSTGVLLSTWIWSPDNGREGTRGGHDLTISENVIDGANHFGVTGYFYATTLEGNEIKNIGLIANLGKSGMGCGTTGASCTENGDGIRIRRYEVLDSGHSNVLRYNRISRTGYNGVDVFGPNNTLEYNFIQEPCYSKGDCGGVRTFGNDSLAATQVYNISLKQNIIVDSLGNVDGVIAAYHEPFGMGLYIDHYSKNVQATGNTVINSTITGILYQHSSGEMHANTIYNAASGTMYCGQVSLAGADTQLSAMRDNVFYGFTDNAWTLSLSDAGLAGSDNNYFFHPYIEKHLTSGGWAGRKTLAEWQAYSGQDGASRDAWFTLAAGEAPRSKVFYNATQDPLSVDLEGRQYLDLDQNLVYGSFILQPFTSRVLVDSGKAPLTLTAMTPSLLQASEAADFELRVEGTGFTSASVVRWDGADRPTAFGSASLLTATISASDVASVTQIAVSVYDPSPVPTGTQTSPLTFSVVESLLWTYLPVILK